MRCSYVFHALVIGAFLIGCGDEPPRPPDADAAMDATADSSTDATPDATPDATSDATADTTPMGTECGPGDPCPMKMSCCDGSCTGACCAGQVICGFSCCPEK
jgi:hypothetical protein